MKILYLKNDFNKKLSYSEESKYKAVYLYYRIKVKNIYNNLCKINT